MTSEIVHDSEYYVTRAANREAWDGEDAEIGERLTSIESDRGRRPNIIHLMWDDMACGDLVVSQDADVHQISNLQTAGQDLVTLHIYSPPMLRMDTYSLTEPTIGEYRPEILEHMGSGI